MATVRPTCATAKASVSTNLHKQLTPKPHTKKIGGQPRLCGSVVGPKCNAQCCKENQTEPRGVVDVTGSEWWGWHAFSVPWSLPMAWTSVCTQGLGISGDRIERICTGSRLAPWPLSCFFPMALIGSEYLPGWWSGTPSLSVQWGCQWHENDYPGLAQGHWAEHMHRTAKKYQWELATVMINSWPGVRIIMLIIVIFNILLCRTWNSTVFYLPATFYGICFVAWYLHPLSVYPCYFLVHFKVSCGHINTVLATFFFF